jgi:hypothetical protein
MRFQFVCFFARSGWSRQPACERVPRQHLRDWRARAGRRAQAALPLELPDQYTQRGPVGQGGQQHHRQVLHPLPSCLYSCRTGIIIGL